jgi:hypothetical protein
MFFRATRKSLVDKGQKVEQADRILLDENNNELP